MKAKKISSQKNNDNIPEIKEIPFHEISGVQVGNAQNNSAKTGVTVFYFPQGAIAGIDISGGGPASRETTLLDPTKAALPINAIVLSGGSAYGLAASDGVMRCLEEHNIGYETGFAKVPLVVQSSVYDLSYGKSNVRPDAAMGKKACSDALSGNHPLSGNIGAGIGTTVGKLSGMEHGTKAGIGYYAVQTGKLKIGAAVVVNSLGDIYDSKGAKIAGLMNEDRSAFADSFRELCKITMPEDLFTRTNTAIGIIVTNGNFSMAQLTRIAAQTQNAYARCINPVGTLCDGDTIYAASCGEKITADLNVTGTVAAYVMAKAIENSITSAKISDIEYLANCLPIP